MPSLHLLRGRTPLGAFAVFGLLLIAIPARAQNSNSSALCSANAPNFNFALAVQQTASSSSFQTIAPAAINTVLNLAECECGSAPGATPDANGHIPGLDLFLRGQVTKPITSIPEFHVFAGTSCNVSTNQNTTCDDLAAVQVSADQFRLGNTGGPPVQAVPVISMVSPGTSGTHTCTMNNATNSLWFLFGPLAMPDYCQVEIDYHGNPPDAPRTPTAGSGDEAVSLSWNAPVTGTAFPPQNYQVLCADENGNPVGAGAFSFGETPNGRFQLGYTTCIDPAAHLLQRRVLPQTSGGSATDDGGVSTGVDLGAVVGPGETPSTMDVPTTNDEPLTTQADPTDGGLTAAPGCDLPDGGAVKVFDTLDKRFVCSELLDKTATSTRISNLKNNVNYFFTIVAIDQYGNATPSPILCAKPQPVQDLWRRFLAEGGQPQGFCFIATAAWGSYQNPFVMVLRDFRDKVLLPTESGAAFVAWYYRTSPPIADWIRPRPWARFLVRCALWPVIVGAGLWMWLGSGEWLALGLLVGALVYVRRARRRRSAEENAARGGSLDHATSVPLAPAGSEA